jgi:hypothetical protein
VGGTGGVILGVTPLVVVVGLLVLVLVTVLLGVTMGATPGSTPIVHPKVETMSINTMTNGEKRFNTIAFCGVIGINNREVFPTGFWLNLF